MVLKKPPPDLKDKIQSSESEEESEDEEGQDLDKLV